MSLNNSNLEEEEDDINNEFIIKNTNEEKIINSNIVLAKLSSPTSIPEVFNKNICSYEKEQIGTIFDNSENFNDFSTSLLNNNDNNNNNNNNNNLSDSLLNDTKLQINVEKEEYKYESQDSIAYFPTNSHLPTTSSMISPINNPLKSGNINGSPILSTKSVTRPGPLSIDDKLFNDTQSCLYKSPLNKTNYLGNEAIRISRGLLDNINENSISPTSKDRFDIESFNNITKEDYSKRSNNSSLNAIDQCLDALSLNTSNLHMSDGLIKNSSNIQYGIDKGKLQDNYNFDSRINNNLSPINSPYQRHHFNQNSDLDFSIDYNTIDLGESNFQRANSLRSPYPSSPMQQFENSFSSPYSNSRGEYQNRDLSLLSYNNGLVYTIQFKRLHKNYLIEGASILKIKLGDFVKVEADRGEDLGVVCDIVSVHDMRGTSILNKLKSSTGSIKRILRLANDYECDQLKTKMEEEINIIFTCRDISQSVYMLPMSVVDAEYQFDRHKLTIYYEASRRIDFRELVRDLFAQFKTRIWMEHITYSFRPHDGATASLATGNRSYFFNPPSQASIAHLLPPPTPMQSNNMLSPRKNIDYYEQERQFVGVDNFQYNSHLQRSNIQASCSSQFSPSRNNSEKIFSNPYSLKENSHTNQNYNELAQYNDEVSNYQDYLQPQLQSPQQNYSSPLSSNNKISDNYGYNRPQFDPSCSSNYSTP